MCCVSQVLNQRHSMLKRQALLLKAGCDALREEDKTRLEVRMWLV